MNIPALILISSTIVLIITAFISTSSTIIVIITVITAFLSTIIVISIIVVSTIIVPFISWNNLKWNGIKHNMTIMKLNYWLNIWNNLHSWIFNNFFSTMLIICFKNMVWQGIPFHNIILEMLNLLISIKPKKVFEHCCGHMNPLMTRFNNINNFICVYIESLNSINFVFIYLESLNSINFVFIYLESLNIIKLISGSDEA